MSTAVQHAGNGSPAGLVIHSTQQMQLAKQTVAQGLSDPEFRLFIAVCNRAKLDPFVKQIYAIKRGGKMTIQTSIDGFRLIAERSGHYAGQVGPQWCGPDGQWRDVWLETTHPAAARIGVVRHDFREPLWAVARWASYAQNSSTWQQYPDLMLAKCAESLALRRAFTQDLSGLYTTEEMPAAGGSQQARAATPARTAGAPAEPREVDYEITDDGEPGDEADYEAGDAREPEVDSEVEKRRKGWFAEFNKRLAAESIVWKGRKWNRMTDGERRGYVAAILKESVATLSDLTAEQWVAAYRGMVSGSDPEAQS